VKRQSNGGELLQLCWLRYAGSASLWGFAIYLASRGGYEDSLPSGLTVGTPEETLDAPSGSTWPTPTPGGSLPTKKPLTTHELPYVSTWQPDGTRA